MVSARSGFSLPSALHCCLTTDQLAPTPAAKESFPGKAEFEFGNPAPILTQAAKVLGYLLRVKAKRYVAAASGAGGSLGGTQWRAGSAVVLTYWVSDGPSPVM